MMHYLSRGLKSLCYVCSYTSLCIVLLTGSAYANEVQRAEGMSADLSFHIGVYREDSKFTFKDTSKLTQNSKENDHEEEPAEKLDLKKSDNVPMKIRAAGTTYVASGGVGYSLTVPKSGMFVLRAGYTYPINRVGYGMLNGIKEKLKDNSYPYASLSWEKDGFLLMQNVTMGVGIVASDERKTKDSISIKAVSGLRYRIGGITSIYASVQYEIHPSTELESDRADFIDKLSSVIGIEISL